MIKRRWMSDERMNTSTNQRTHAHTHAHAHKPVATDWIRQVLLGIFEPRVESGGPFGKGQVQVFDLAELLLNGKEALLPRLRVLLQTLPSAERKRR